MLALEKLASNLHVGKSWHKFFHLIQRSSGNVILPSNMGYKLELIKSAEVDVRQKFKLVN